MSAYAPDSGEPQAEHEEYTDALRRCFVACNRDIMVVGTDTNSSIGVRSRHDDTNAPDRDRVRGPFGIPHDNFRGRELHAILGLQQLALSTTFFRKTARGWGMGRGKYRYAQTTWYHPRSKDPYQIDHFFQAKCDEKGSRCWGGELGGR